MKTTIAKKLTLKLHTNPKKLQTKPKKPQTKPIPKRFRWDQITNMGALVFGLYIGIQNVPLANTIASTILNAVQNKIVGYLS